MEWELLKEFMKVTRDLLDKFHPYELNRPEAIAVLEVMMKVNKARKERALSEASWVDAP